jgi:hypothetical protein
MHDPLHIWSLIDPQAANDNLRPRYLKDGRAECEWSCFPRPSNYRLTRIVRSVLVEFAWCGGVALRCILGLVAVIYGITGRWRARLRRRVVPDVAITVATIEVPIAPTDLLPVSALANAIASWKDV